MKVLGDLEIPEYSRGPQNEEYFIGHIEHNHSAGYKVVVFYDWGQLKCIDEIMTKDHAGIYREIDFWSWPECEEKDMLMFFRGV